MPVYTHRFKVKAPVGQVAEFHQNATVLKRLTPPPVIVQLHTVEPLAEDSVVDFTMWMGPIPVRWVAVHSEVSLVSGFTDSQVSGPFKRWVHRHEFVSLDDRTTEIVDTIDAEPGGRVFWGVVSRFMWLNLDRLFSHREKVTRQILEWG
jgi:ligand-binding SRPBCC domain-containing protein